MKKAFRYSLLAMLFATLVSGCDSDDQGGSDTLSPGDTLADTLSDALSDALSQADTPDEGGTCAAAGTWSGTVATGPFAGQTNVWVLNAGGTWTGTMTAASINGTWSLAGTTLSVTDTSSTPASVACPSAQVGTYQVSFSADCRTMTLDPIDEPCEGRLLVLDGFAPTRAN